MWNELNEVGLSEEIKKSYECKIDSIIVFIEINYLPNDLTSNINLLNSVKKHLNGTNFRVDKCSRFSRILLKFAKLNPREIFDTNRFAKINLPEYVGNGKFAKINAHEIFLKNVFLLCFFPPFIFQATNTIQMCIMKL